MTDSLDTFESRRDEVLSELCVKVLESVNPSEMNVNPPVVKEDSGGIGVASLKAFTFGLGLLAVPTTLFWGSIGGPLSYGVAGVVALYLISRNDPPSPYRSMTFNEVRMRAFSLGWGFSLGLQFISSGYSFPFGLYVCLLSFFHYSEFLMTSYISPDTLSLDSFLLNHSKEYGIAALASIVEFHLELYLLPWLKSLTFITATGMILCVGGELIRKLSMLTASKNFTHLVRHQKADGQYLVTSGPYAICRHPGYAGWFWWSIGTQLVLINPVCFVGYCFAVYKFFHGRIYYEEICLLSFFGLEYVNYQMKVPRTGVPFVEGYITHMSSDNPQPEIEDDDDDD